MGDGRRRLTGSFVRFLDLSGDLTTIRHLHAVVLGSAPNRPRLILVAGSRTAAAVRPASLASGLHVRLQRATRRARDLVGHLPRMPPRSRSAGGMAGRTRERSKKPGTDKLTEHSVLGSPWTRNQQRCPTIFPLDEFNYVWEVPPEKIPLGARNLSRHEFDPAGSPPRVDYYSDSTMVALCSSTYDPSPAHESTCSAQVARYAPLAPLV